MELEVTGKSGTKNLQVSDNTFQSKSNPALVHQVLVACMAAKRAGTKAQKTRAEVSGGGAKPWRQKGTGRARAGTTRSPIWRSGGVTFAAKPRSYEQKINKKMYQGALRAILSELVKQDRLVIVEDLTLSSPKTKELVTKLKDLSIQDALVVMDNIDQNFNFAMRNLHQIEACRATDINPINLMTYEKVLLTIPAVKKIEEWLG